MICRKFDKFIPGFPPPLDFPPDCSSPESGADDDEEPDEDDLTGLSDKLHTLELSKISNLPPREIRELQKASEELNSRFTNSLQMTRMPGKEDVEEEEEEEEEEESVLPSVQQSLSENANSTQGCYPMEESPEIDLNQNVPETISEEEGAYQQVFTEHKADEVTSENLPCNHSNQDMPQCDTLETTHNDLNGECEDSPLSKEESLRVEREAVSDDLRDVEFVGGSCDQTEDSGSIEEDWNAFPSKDVDWGEPVKVGGEEKWGDFGDQGRTVKSIYDEEDDDEFGDFGEAEDAAPNENRDVLGLLQRLEELRDWSELSEILGNKGDQGETDCESRLGQELGLQVEEDKEVWRLLEDPGIKTCLF